MAGEDNSFILCPAWDLIFRTASGKLHLKKEKILFIIGNSLAHLTTWEDISCVWVKKSHYVDGRSIRKKWLFVHNSEFFFSSAFHARHLFPYEFTTDIYDEGRKVYSSPLTRIETWEEERVSIAFPNVL